MSNTSLYEPKYVSLEAIKWDLEDKVFFSNSKGDGISDNEVLDCIEEAESIIELQLSRQYLIPFQGFTAQCTLVPFNQITNKSTKKYINKLCSLQTAILLMQTIFGRTEGVRGDDYRENYQKQLDDQLEFVFGKDPKTGEYLYPPLPELALNKNASYFRAGIYSPLIAGVGVASNSYGNQVLARQINGVQTFWMYSRNGNRRWGY
jgi:hypothetical protein